MQAILIGNKGRAMVLDGLYEFVVFSKHLNISAAARELNISQPTLSKHLSELERDTGIKLIVHGKDLRLTSAGKIFLEEAGFILHHYNEAIKSCKAAEKAAASELRIQDPVSFEPLQHAIRNAMARLFEAGESADIALISTQGHTALEAMENDIVDIAFTFRSPSSCSDVPNLKNGIRAVPLMRDRLQALMGPENTLAQKEHLRFEDLQHAPIRVPANKIYDDWRNVITDIFAKNEMTPNFSLRVIQTINEFSFIPPGDEVMLAATENASSDRYPNFVRKEIDGPFNELILYAIFREGNPNPAVPHFAEYMKINL